MTGKAAVDNVTSPSPKPPSAVSSLSAQVLVTTPSGEVLDLRELFDRLDQNKNGRLSLEELQSGCKILGFSLTVKELEVLIISLSVHHSAVFGCCPF